MEGKATNRHVFLRMVREVEMSRFLIAVMKLILTCPLSYSLRKMVALDPREMVAYPNICRSKFKRMLTVLVNSNKLRGDNCDSVLQEYSNFLDSVPIIGSDIFSSSIEMLIELMIFFYPHDR